MRAWRPTAAETAVLLACIIVAGVLALCVVFGPAWLARPEPGLTAAERLSAENDARSTLLQGLVGLLALGGVAFGAVVTLRQVRAGREGRSIDLFTKAIDQLASDQVSVRHGGVYALEQLSELDARYRGHAHALLTAFVRQNAPWPPSKPDSEVLAERARLQGGLPPGWPPRRLASTARGKGQHSPSGPTPGRTARRLAGPAAEPGDVHRGPAWG